MSVASSSSFLGIPARPDSSQLAASWSPCGRSSVLCFPEESTECGLSQAGPELPSVVDGCSNTSDYFCVSAPVWSLLRMTLGLAV